MKALMKKLDSFTAARLQSLSGIVPVGIFIVWHYFIMASAKQGPEHFNQTLEGLHNRSYLIFFEIVLIYIPILLHAGLGIRMMMKSKFAKDGITQLPKAPYERNIRYILQRLSGIGLLGFVAAHFYKTRLSTFLFDIPMTFEHFAEGLQSPITLTVYFLGLIGTAYHLANGLFTFCITWGITVGPRAQKVAAGLSIVVGILLLFVGFDIIFSIKN
jgi:succinate dehydrogenase / fumarate reductase cytochrome b subunit